MHLLQKCKWKAVLENAQKKDFDSTVLQACSCPLTLLISHGLYFSLIMQASFAEKAKPPAPCFLPPSRSEHKWISEMQHPILFLASVTCSFSLVFASEGEAKASVQRLWELSSHKHGWPGATAVCLIACSMGVGSIIRAAASPPCSKPSVLCSCRFNSLSQYGKQHLWWTAAKTQGYCEHGLRTHTVDVLINLFVFSAPHMEVWLEVTDQQGNLLHTVNNYSWWKSSRHHHSVH